MSDKVFFDTNILVYSFGSRESKGRDERRDAAQELLIAGGRVSVQVLNEFVQVCRNKISWDWPRILESLHVVQELCGRALPMTFETHESALGLCRRYGFHIYDSLILATAIESRCSMVYSEDLQHGQTVEGVRIANPFL